MKPGVHRGMLSEGLADFPGQDFSVLQAKRWVVQLDEPP